MANDAELLADLLDGRLDVAQAPTELARLAELAGAVSQHVTLVPPTPAFRAALRQELLDTIGGTGSGPSDGGSVSGSGGGGGASGLSGSSGVSSAGAALATGGASSIPGVIAAVAAAAVLATSTSVATAESVPGDPLYGLKQGIESVQLTLASDARDVELLVGFATERVREAIGLTDPAVVVTLLDESERLLDDALELAVVQGRQVDGMLDRYASALVTLDSRTEDPTVRAQLGQLMDDVGVSSSPTPPRPVAPDLGPGDGTGADGETPGPDDEEPGDDAPARPDGGATDDPVDGLDDPVDDLDPLDDPLDELDDPLDELDDPLDDLESELDGTLDGATDALGR